MGVQARNKSPINEQSTGEQFANSTKQEKLECLTHKVQQQTDQRDRGKLTKNKYTKKKRLIRFR